MKSINKLIIILLGILSLQSCNNEIEEPKDMEPKESPMVMLRANIDPRFEYDDEEGLRAAQFTAEDAPRIKISPEDFAGPTSAANNLNSASTYDRTTLRLNFIAFDKENTAKAQYGVNIYNGLQSNTTLGSIVDLKEKDGKYQLNARVKMSDIENLKHIPDATWFGQMILGGMPGIEEADSNEGAMQYFSATRRAKDNNQVYINTSPNHRIDELDGTNTTMARRHFPMMSKFVKMELTNTKGVEGAYDDKGNNTGTIVTELKPRGTIFIITVENDTDKGSIQADVELKDIMVETSYEHPHSFEGLFNGAKAKPFKNGNIDPEGGVSPFEKYYNINPLTGKPFEGIEVLGFPLYNRKGERNIRLNVGEKTGKLMLWTYIQDPNEPVVIHFNCGILDIYNTSYGSGDPAIEDSSNVPTMDFSINPPQGGFKESKAYRVNLKLREFAVLWQDY